MFPRPYLHQFFSKPEETKAADRSSTPVDLSNWTLVGDDSNGVNFTETFPAGTILNPGDFLVVGDGKLGLCAC